jgi:hypothetical protein
LSGTVESVSLIGTMVPAATPALMTLANWVATNVVNAESYVNVATCP